MPRKLVVVVMLVSWSSLACVTTHHAQRPATVEDFDAIAERGRISVVGRNPAKIVGFETEGLALKGAWVGPPEQPRYLRLGDIRVVEVRNHALGAGEGLAWGALSGAAFGAIAGFASGSDDPNKMLFAFTAGQKALIFGAALGVIGAVVGLVAGAAAGHVDRYEF